MRKRSKLVILITLIILISLGLIITIKSIFYPIINIEKDFIFRDDTFKILQLSDLHIVYYMDYNNNSYKLINNLIKKSNPDLIVLAGDNVVGENATIAMTNLCTYINKYNIPWTFVFGNHDSEKDNNRQELADIAKNFSKCLFSDGPDNIDGIGNHILELKDENGKLKQALVFFDTHRYYLNGCDNVHDNQIEWYENSILELSKDGEIIPSLMFIHIPFREFDIAYKSNEKESIYGQNVDYDPTMFGDSNLFQSILDLNSTKGVFSGHLHKNSSSIIYKGVQLTFGNTSNVDIGLEDSNIEVGGTLITINRDSSFTVEPIF